MTHFNSMFLKYQNYFLKKSTLLFDKQLDKLINHLTTESLANYRLSDLKFRKPKLKKRIKGTASRFKLKPVYWMYTINFMFIGPCIILKVEKRQTNLMSLVLLFHYLLLNMFRMLVHPSSGVFKYFIILIVSTYYILCISWIIECLIVE